MLQGKLIKNNPACRVDYIGIFFPQVWLPAVKAKGLEISGTFSRRQGHMYMDMTFTNKALQHMTDFAVQFNKNR